MPSDEDIKRAYLAMEALQRRVKAQDRARAEPIAVVGMACRFPGRVSDPESLWQALTDGHDAITEVPSDRWDVDAYFDATRTPGKTASRWGGFLDGIGSFDHEFFGISRREAVSMDPQHRLLLEVTWEALEDAGLTPAHLAGSRTGVFTGIASNDYAHQVFQVPDRIEAHASTGNAHSIATGRISYLLDLKGPAIAVDTACSSSIVAMHQGCQSLRLGESDLALCGAVNVVLSPAVTLSFAQFPEMLARDGRCKSFDASADGFVRSEGCGVVVLKRLSDAVRDGDAIWAVVRGSALNQDGRSSGLTAPNGSAQVALLRRALEVSGVAPDTVGYIETHGAGTKLGDPIEFEALNEVYGRSDGAPLVLGAVKSNLGHLEAASGMAGFIKAVLSVEKGRIPGNLHFTSLNPHICLDGTTFVIPTETRAWPDLPGPRRAGLSSFGFSGTNTHVLIEQAPPVPETAETGRGSRPVVVLPLSARTEPALLKLARRYRDAARGLAPQALADFCASAATGRAPLGYRLAVSATTSTDLVRSLGDVVRGDPVAGASSGRVTAGAATDVVFAFTGQGPQRIGMAMSLYDIEPTVRQVLTDCDRMLRPHLPRPLLEVLSAPGDAAVLDDMRYAQPALFAVELALASMWESWGVRPAAVIGHSLGEYAAACFAGVMSTEDGLALVARRGALLQELATTGSMAAIFAPADAVHEVLGRYREDDIAVAAHNGPTNTTVSGRREVVDEVVALFLARGVDARLLRISTSSHSPLIEPVLPRLRQALDAVDFAPPRLPLVANLTGTTWPWQEPMTSDYWLAHARQPVRFAGGVSALLDEGCRIFLEVGPSPTLLGLVGDIAGAERAPVLVPTLRPKTDEWETVVAAVSTLYVHGVDLDWSAFAGPPVRRLRLPHYPFERVTCWQEPAPPGEQPTTWGRTSSAAAPETATGPVDQAAAEDRPRPARATRPASSLPTQQELLAWPSRERVELLIPRLLRSVELALGSRSTAIDPDEPLTGLGLDSLMAVELRNEVQTHFGIAMSIAGVLSGGTIRSLAEQVVAQTDGSHAPAEATAGDVIRRQPRRGDPTQTPSDSPDERPADAAIPVADGVP
ncbi:MAG: type I polyketide synthase [Dermatophilaceae bacterium]